MFGKIFGRRSTPSPPSPAPEHPATAALLDTIARQRASDPLIGAKMAGKEILPVAMAAARKERGVHVESLFAALGALAGFSCQMAIRAQFASRPSEPLPFHVVSAADGRAFYFGDALNAPLAESQYSIWSLSAGKAQTLGATLPDVTDIFAHVSRTVGTADFGVPRFPGEFRAAALPVDYLKALWPTVRATVGKYCGEPSEWPIAIGLAIQEAIEAAKQAIDPGAAVTIVMESAIPMSKLDPQEIGQAGAAPPSAGPRP